MLDLDAVVRVTNRRITKGDALLMQRCCDAVEARTILEIGSADGGSTVVLGDKARERGGHLWCIEPKVRGVWRANVTNYKLDPFVTMIQAGSPWVPWTIVADGKPIDLLFIDGDHRTRWCLADYHYWAPRVRVGGAILFHDWTSRSPTREWVRRAIAIILEDDKLEEMDRSEERVNYGTIAYRKTA